MSSELIWTGASLINSYTCDLCKDAYLSRVLTDSYSGIDICLTCASMGDRGLFYRVTQSPDEEGDNLFEVAADLDLIDSEEVDYGDEVMRLGRPL